MRFFQPAWLWGLLLIPLLYWGVIFDEKRRIVLFSQFSNRKLWPLIAPEADLSHRLRKSRFTLAALALALISLARPQFGTHEEVAQASGLDIVLALDVSSSMNVEDVVPSRLQKAKHFIHSLLDRLDGDRVGVVAFAGSSFVASPITTDLSYLWDTVQILSPKTIPNQGTDIGLGLDTALKALERGGQESASPETKAQATQVILLVSDGEDHEDQALAMAKKIRETGVKLYVLGVGTEKGGPIPIKDANGNSQGFKKTRSGEPIISAFHSEFLSELAKASGGLYWNLTASEGEAQELLADLAKLGRSDYGEHRYVVYEDRFQIPLAIALILLLLEVSVLARKRILISLFLMLPLLGTSDARANLGSYLENQKGLSAYQEGNLEEAQKKFGAAQARDPNLAELDFNQGIVQFQKDQTDDAIESFKRSLQNSRTRKDQNLSAKSLYNLGKAYTKKGDLNEAVRSYANAIRSAAESGNSTLEDESRKNLELLVQEQKKQDQKPDQNKDSKEKESKGEKDQNNQEQKPDQKAEKDSKKDQEEKKSQKNQSQEKKGDRKNSQFDSKKMTREDADRVMSELKTKERELQERLQSQNVKSKDNPKDW